jgi:hypothetical protein
MRCTDPNDTRRRALFLVIVIVQPAPPSLPPPRIPPPSHLPTWNAGWKWVLKVLHEVNRTKQKSGGAVFRLVAIVSRSSTKAPTSSWNLSPDLPTSNPDCQRVLNTPHEMYRSKQPAAVSVIARRRHRSTSLEEPLSISLRNWSKRHIEIACSMRVLCPLGTYDHTCIIVRSLLSLPPA